MTKYAVTVEFTGDFIVEAGGPEEAEEHVQNLLPHATPDSDWYFTQITDVKEEDA